MRKRIPPLLIATLSITLITSIAGSFPRQTIPEAKLMRSGSYMPPEPSRLFPPLVSLLLISVIILLLLIGVILVVRRILLQSSDEVTPVESSEATVKAHNYSESATNEATERGSRYTVSDTGNIIFCAWFAMINNISDADPQSKTPSEFATLAIQAGVDRRDVNDLTRQFQQVRYGGQKPTNEDRRQVTQILERNDIPCMGNKGER